MNAIQSINSRVFTSDELEARGMLAAAQSYCVKEGILHAVNEPLQGWRTLPSPDATEWKPVNWSLLDEEDQLACWTILGFIFQSGHVQ